MIHMPTIYKILGQVAISGATTTGLYTAPAGKNTVCSTLSACAIGSTSYLRIAAVPSGQVNATNKNFLLYDTYVNQYDSLSLTLGITLNASDKITVYASGGGPVAFSLFGAEIS